MNWETIILSVVGAAFFGDMIMRLLFKSDRRIAEAKAEVAEAEAEVAEAEALKAHDETLKLKDEAHAKHCKQYEERIEDLNNSITRLNTQLDRYIERDAAKEKRFDEQTQKLRDVQRKLLEATQQITELVKKQGMLEIELERKRCDEIRCPFRQPPTAYTEPMSGLTKEEYFVKRKTKKK